MSVDGLAELSNRRPRHNEDGRKRFHFPSHTEQIVNAGRDARMKDTSGVELPGGAPTPLTDAIDADEGEFTDTPGARTLTVDCGSLSPGETCTVTYGLVIQQLVVLVSCFTHVLRLQRACAH